MIEQLQYDLAKLTKELRIHLIEIEAIIDVKPNSQLSEARMHLIHCIENLRNVRL